MLLRVARPHDAILRRVPGVGGMHDIDDYPEAQTIPGLVVYRYDAPLFFANPRISSAGRSPRPTSRRSRSPENILNVEATWKSTSPGSMTSTRYARTSQNGERYRSRASQAGCAPRP